MQKIHAWVRNPKDNLFKGMSKHCELRTIYCSNPEACDMYVKHGTCILRGVLGSCKFGKQTAIEGPTAKAKSFRETINRWTDENKNVLNALGELKAWKRIFLTNGHYYLPYAHMSGCDGSPIPGGNLFKKIEFLPEDDLNAELLEKICTAQPRALYGGVIDTYQEKEVPKFIHDIKKHYPHLFDMLPDEQKERVKDVNFVGRKADIATCPPCEFVISGDTWKWDGEFITGKCMSFPPIRGDVDVRIRPNIGEAVKITNNNQVNENTRFLD